jgi:glutathione synthase/RimK-type ligase-like ATP-grasp enzyme
MDILLATYQGSPEPTPSDRLLAEALARRGIPVTARPWDSIDPADRTAGMVCIRSAWDYHLRIDEFSAWVSAFRAEPGRLWNPPETVLGNLDKHYLRRLERSGIALPITHWLAPGEPVDLGALFGMTGWPSAVLKPRVSASAYGTILVTPGSTLSAEETASLSATGALMQEFIPEIRTRGEISLMFFGGRYSHAVCKEVARGEFRVQPHLGGEATVVEVSPELREFGARILEAVPSPWIYARVDLVQSERGPLLMELELIEPELFFHLAPEGADALAGQMSLVAQDSAR